MLNDTACDNRVSHHTTCGCALLRIPTQHYAKASVYCNTILTVYQLYPFSEQRLVSVSPCMLFDGVNVGTQLTHAIQHTSLIGSLLPLTIHSHCKISALYIRWHILVLDLLYFKNNSILMGTIQFYGQKIQ